MMPITEAWRSWKHAKMVALLSILALAIGTGATTAIYTVVNAVMLKPLSYGHSERFVALFGQTLIDTEHYSSSTYPDLQKYEQRVQSFDVFGWFRFDDFNLTSPGQPQHLNGVAVTPSLALGLGVNPVVGRWFTDDTGAVISTALWNRLGRDPSIVGRSIVLNGRSYTVAGIMPPQFRLPETSADFRSSGNDVWIGLDPNGRGQSPDQGLYFCYARRKPGVTLAQAEADVKRVAAEIAAEDPIRHPSYTARIDPLRDTIIKGIRPTLLLLFAAAGLVLLITCANVSGLLVARSVARARDTAIRVSLGATVRQLAIHYFLEALFVAMTGAALGLVVSAAVVRLVVSISADYIPRADHVAIDWKVLLFAAATALASSALACLTPLWQASRTVPSDVLNEGSRSSASVRSRKLSHSLVIAEIALAFALLATSGVLIAHLDKLNRVLPGFDPKGLMTFEVTLPDAILASESRRVPYQARLVDALRAIPDVNGVAHVNQLPLDGCCLSTTIYPEGSTPRPGLTEQRVGFLPVSTDYFQTMRIPLRGGRTLTESDARSGIAVTVINEAAADHYWPGRDPVGLYGRFGGTDGDRFQVVGVVGNVRNDGLGSPTVPEVYLPAAAVAVNPLNFVVRSALPRDVLIAQMRQAVQSVDPSLPIHDVATMEEITTHSLTLQRVGSIMTTFFAIAAVVMATLGVYGVVAYSVRQRVVELGTRMVLGATSLKVLELVIGGGLRMAVFGIGGGGILAIAGTWIFSRALGLPDVTIIPFLSSTVVIAGVALGASFFPAWRATFLSPLAAIRNQPDSMWRSAQRGIRHAIQSVSETLASVTDGSGGADQTLLIEFAEAARRSHSSSEVLGIALTTLCSKLGARSGVLLERSPHGDYRSAAVSGESELSDIRLPAQGLLLHRLRVPTLPLTLSSADFDTWERWAAEKDTSHLIEIQILKRAAVCAAAALRMRNEIVGVLLLGPPVGRTQYSSEEKRLLSVAAQQLALMIENIRLTSRIVEQEKLRRDLALAAEVQRRLLPEQAPETSIGSLAGFSIPARSVGGDYFDFIELGEKRFGIGIADVAGKGIAAALIMSVVQASLRIISSEGQIPLPELAARMNAFLYRSTPSNSYATFFYAEIDERSRRMNYINAGHNSPLLVRSSVILELPASGTVLGLFPQMTFEDAAIDLESGDLLVAFTDGVTEALNPAGEEFGDGRLRQLLRRVAPLTAAEITTQISNELKTWIADAPQHDDLTVIVMKV
jgi:putative ABC transport system permease protein